MANNAFVEYVSKQTLEEGQKAIAQLNQMIEKIGIIGVEAQKVRFPSESKKIISDVNNELTRSKKVLTDTEAAQKKYENALRNYNVAASKTGKEIIKVRNETNKLNLENKKSLDAWGRLQLKLSQAERTYRNLAASQGKGAAATIKAKAAVDRLRTSIDAINQPIKRFSDNVGNYPKRLVAATGALRTFVSAFGLTSGVFLFVQVLRDGFKAIREFDKSMQNLSGILRTNRKDLRDLEDVIIDVAGKSVNTATSVAKLAESLITLGKSKSEVKQLLQPVNDLSIGLNTTGEEAAEFLVQTLNAFGKGSESAGEYADIIATIRTSTSLDFQKMRDSFQYLTPISKILNKDLAYTGSILGVLADNGLKAESAGRLLGTAQQRLAKEGKTLAQGLAEINDASARGVKEVALLEIASNLFGKQAAKVGVILASNTEEIDTNAEAIRNNKGALEDLVGEQLKSLDASLLILKSRWEEYILRSNEAGGLSNKLAKIVNYLADNLDKIVDTIVDVAQSFLIYKGILLATSLLTKAYTATTVALRIAKIALSGGIGKATIAMRAFNVATKANPLGILMSAVSAGIAIWYSFSDSVKDTAQSLREARKEADQIRESIVAANIALVQEQLNRINEEIKNEKKAVAEKIKLVQEEIKARKDGSKLLSEILSDAEEDEKVRENKEDERIKRIKSRVKEEISGANELAESVSKSRMAVTDVGTKDFADDLSGNEETVKALQKILDDLKKSQEELNKPTPTGDGNAKSAKDAFNLQKQRLQNEIKINEDIAKNNEESLEDRLAANQVVLDKTDDLNKLEKDFAVSNAQGRVDEITRIEEEYLINKENAIQNSEDNLDAIFEDNFKNQKDRIKELSEEQKAAQDRGVFEIRERGRIEGRSRKDIERDVQDFIQKEREKAINNEINRLSTLLDTLALNGEERKKIEKEIIDLKIQLLDIYDNADQAAEAKRLERIRNTEKAVSDSVAAIGDIVSVSFDRRISKIDDEIEANEVATEAKLRNFRGTDEERQQIEEAAEQRRKQLEKKRREDMIKKAKFEKAIAIAQAVIGTAAAVIEQGVVTPAAILAGVLGAIQIAVIAAEPIPQYKHGKGANDNYEGAAVVGDGGRKEVIYNPKTKKVQVTPSTPTVTNVLKDDMVFSSLGAFDDYSKNNLMLNDPIMTSRYAPSLITPDTVNTTIDVLMSDFNSRMEEKIEKVIKKGFKSVNLNVYNSNPVPDMAALLRQQKSIDV